MQTFCAPTVPADAPAPYVKPCFPTYVWPGLITAAPSCRADISRAPSLATTPVLVVPPFRCQASLLVAILPRRRLLLGRPKQPEVDAVRHCRVGGWAGMQVVFRVVLGARLGGRTEYRRYDPSKRTWSN